MKIVVIGAGAAGTSAALETRKVNREAEVTVINSEEYPSYQGAVCLMQSQGTSLNSKT